MITEYRKQHFADYTLSVDIDGDSRNLEQAAEEGGESLKGIGKSGKEVASEIKSAFEGVGKTLQTLGKGFSDVGKVASVAVTAPVVGIAKKSMDAFGQVDSGLDTIAAKTGATGKEMEGFKDILEDVATTIPVSFGDAGDAIGEVSTRFGVTGDELNELSKQFLKFSQVNETEVSGSVDKVQATMAAFGVETKDASKFLDTLNQVGQETGIKMDDLLGLMESNATSLKELGFGASDSTRFLGGLSKSGVDTGAVMGGLKKALASATKEGKTMPQALAELQDSLSNTEDKTGAMQKAIEIFGAKSGPAIFDACQDGRLSFEALGTSLDDSAGNLEKTFEEMQDPADEFYTTMNELIAAGSDLAEVIQGMLAPVMDDLKGEIQDLREWFNGLTPEEQEMIVKTAAIAAVIGPVLVILGKLISGIGSIAGAIGGLTGFIGGLIPEGMTLAGLFSSIASAVALPVAAIGLLVGAFIYLWQTNEGFRNAMMEIWQGIVQTVTDFVETVKAKLAEAGITGETLRQAWETVVQFIKDLWQGFCDFLAPIFISSFETLSTLLGDALDVILGIVDFFIAVFNGDWDGAWTAVKDIVDGALQFVQDLVQGKIDLIGTHFSGLADFLTAIWSGIMEYTKATWDLIFAIVEPIVTLLKDVITGDMDAARQDVDGILNGILGLFQSIWQTIVDTVGGFLGNIVDSVSEKIGSVAETVKSGFQDAVDFITGLPGQAWQWGADIIGSIAAGIWDCIGQVTSAVSSVADTIKGYLGFSEPEIGPLSDFHTYMPDMIDMMTSGMTAGINKVGKAAEGLAGGIFSGFSPAGTSQVGAYAGAYGGNVTNLGGVTMVVNAQPGQDVSQLADLVADRILERARV